VVSPFLYRESHLDISIGISKTLGRVKWKGEMFLDNPVLLILLELAARGGALRTAGGPPFFPDGSRWGWVCQICPEKKCVKERRVLIQVKESGIMPL
jgi:hypothetical protein